MSGRPGKSNWEFDDSSFFDRIGTAVDSEFSTDNVGKWIEKNTYIDGGNFSFLGHEYQEKILSSRKPEQYIKKCSQLGISELFARVALSLSYMIPNFSTIYTLPTSNFAAKFSKTRLDPVIQSSPLLSAALDPNTNSGELKKIGTSYIYINGTFTQGSAISVPAHMLIHDEVDFSDQDALTSYQSRLTHSPYKWRKNISTPTLPDYGIDEDFKASSRHVNFCKCNHCGEQFIPDYRKHIVVPGYNGDIMALDKVRLPKTRWMEAFLACPRCGKNPDLSPAHREWVVENPDEQHNADGFQISPFDAPSFISVQNLMHSRTRYNRPADFVNFGLGQCDSDELNGIQKSDIDFMEMMYAGQMMGKVLGVDMGTTCHVAECGIDAGSSLQVDGLHKIDYRQFGDEFHKIVQRTRPIAIVMDSQPYTETVVRCQRIYFNLYGSVYVNAKGLRAFSLEDEEENKREALLDERQVNVNRNLAFDFLMEDIRAGCVGLNPDLPKEDREEFSLHLRDMRRIITVENKIAPDQQRFIWVKSKNKVDHFHHSLLYAWVAARLRLAARPLIVVPSYSFLPKIKMKSQL
jgi:hypothetical protein